MSRAALTPPRNPALGAVLLVFKVAVYVAGVLFVVVTLLGFLIALGCSALATVAGVPVW